MFDLIIFEEPNLKKKPNKQKTAKPTFFTCRYYTVNWVFNQYIIKGYLIK